MKGERTLAYYWDAEDVCHELTREQLDAFWADIDRQTTSIMTPDLIAKITKLMEERGACTATTPTKAP